MEIIKSQRGFDKLCYGGFTYTRKKASKSTITWECSRRRTRQCTGVVITDLEKIDIAAAPLTLTSERYKVVQFLGPYMHESLGMLMARPPPYCSMFRVFEPFHPTIWVCIIASLVLNGLVQSFINRFTPFANRHHHPNMLPEQQHAIQISICENLWASICDLLQQGRIDYPSAWSSRIVLLTFWGCVLLIHALWQADMTAHLTKQEVDLPISSWEELPNQSQFRPLVLPGSAQWEWFKMSNGVRQSVFKMLPLSAHHLSSYNNEANLSRIPLDQPEYVVLGSFETLDYVMSRHCEKLLLLRQIGASGMVGFATRQDVEYGQAMSEFLIQAAETGIVDRMRMRWINTTTSPDCLTGKQAAKDSKCNSVNGLLIILSVCTLISSILLTFQYLKQRFFAETIEENNGSGITSMPTLTSSVDRHAS